MADNVVDLTLSSDDEDVPEEKPGQEIINISDSDEEDDLRERIARSAHQHPRSAAGPSDEAHAREPAPGSSGDSEPCGCSHASEDAAAASSPSAASPPTRAFAALAPPSAHRSTPAAGEGAAPEAAAPLGGGQQPPEAATPRGRDAASPMDAEVRPFALAFSA